MVVKIKENLFYELFIWHFKGAPLVIFKTWSNFLKFGLRYFSIPLLLKTIFYPWKRISESYRGGIANFSENLEILILNTFSRFLGFIIKTILIFFGLLFLFFVFITGLIAFLAWIIFPFFVLFGILIGIALLI